MSLVSETLTEIPIGGPNGEQPLLKITPPRSGWIVSDRWQAIVNNPPPPGYGPGSYANGFRGKPLHYLCMDPTVDPTAVRQGITTLVDPNYTTINNNGIFPVTLFPPFRVTKNVPFYSVWANPDDDPSDNWLALDFLKGDPSQVGDIQFQWRWMGAGGVMTPWGTVDAAGNPMQIIPSPYNYVYHDGVVIGYNDVEVVNGVPTAGPQYGFNASQQ